MSDEPEAARKLRRILVRLRALPEAEMRVAALAQTLENLDHQAAVTLLSGLLEHAARVASRDPAPASVLLEGRALAERLGYRWVQNLYKQAKLDGAENVCRLFVTHAPREHQPEPSQATEETLATLGHRKARARTIQRRDEIQAMLAEIDPDVIANLLANPTLTEQDVLKLASRRPTDSATLERIFRHPRWSLRYRVRKALVYNPHTPINVALALLPFLNAIDLKEVARSPTEHDWIRERAREVLLERRR